MSKSAEISSFQTNDLVWARMKCFPDWPGKILNHPKGEIKKRRHWVFFFGSRNFAWVDEDKIKHHSNAMLQSLPKRKYAFFDEAVKEIKKEYQKSKRIPKVNSKGKEKEALIKLGGKKSIKTKPIKVNIGHRAARKSVKGNPPLKDKPQPKKNNKKEEKSEIFIFPEAMKTEVSFPKLVGAKKRKAYLARSSVVNCSSQEESDSSSCSSSQEQFTSIKNKLKREPGMKTIGFIGLGQMGKYIVTRLLKKNYDVWVWNRNGDICDRFVEKGAQKALTPSELVKNTDIIICCVTDKDAVREIMNGKEGILEGFKTCQPQSKGYVEMSSIEPEVSVEMANIVKGAGMMYLEAPIVAYKRLPRELNLTILTAGDNKLFEQCEFIFCVFTEKLYYMTSDVGKAMTMSLMINTMFGTMFASFSEIITLAEQPEFCLNYFLEVLSACGIESALLCNKMVAITQNIFHRDPSFEHLQRSMKMTLQRGKATNELFPVTSSANKIYEPVIEDENF